VGGLPHPVRSRAREVSEGGLNTQLRRRQDHMASSNRQVEVPALCQGTVAYMLMAISVPGISSFDGHYDPVSAQGGGRSRRLLVRAPFGATSRVSVAG
jgi:hypothetical protein